MQIARRLHSKPMFLEVRPEPSMTCCKKPVYAQAEVRMLQARLEQHPAYLVSSVQRAVHIACRSSVVSWGTSGKTIAVSCTIV